MFDNKPDYYECAGLLGDTLSPDNSLPHRGTKCPAPEVRPRGVHSMRITASGPDETTEAYVYTSTSV